MQGGLPAHSRRARPSPSAPDTARWQALRVFLGYVLAVLAALAKSGQDGIQTVLRNSLMILRYIRCRNRPVVSAAV